MAIRTTKNSKGQILSQRSPVRTLLNSEFQTAIKWMARKKDKNGKPIGKITEADSIVKYEKDTFSLYAKSVNNKSVSINDVRGSAVFLRVIEGRVEIADCFLFCLGCGKYILTDWIKVWNVIAKLYRDRGTVKYSDAWRMDKEKFITLLKIAVSDKI